jgi:hypothetical protein
MRYFLAHIRHFLPHIFLCAVLLMINNSWAQGVTGIGNGTSGTRTLSVNSIFRPGGGDFVTVIQNIAIDLFDAIRVILNGVALIAMVYVGYLWVSSMGDEEKAHD